MCLLVPLLYAAVLFSALLAPSAVYGYVLYSPTALALSTLNNNVGQPIDTFLVIDGSSVRVFDVANATSEYAPFSLVNSASSGLTATRGLVVAAGLLFVSESRQLYQAAQGLVQVFNTTTRALVYSITTTLPMLNNPTGLAASSDGTLFVCDTGNNRIVKFVQIAVAPSPAWRQELVLTGSNPQLYQPTAVVYNLHTGQLHVTDGNGRIVQFNAQDGSQTAVIVQSYTDQLVSPISITQDANDNLYTVSAGSVVSVFNSSGSMLGHINSSAWSSPVSVTVDQSNQLWVLDAGSRQVYVVAAPTPSSSSSSSPLSSSSSSAAPSSASSLSSSASASAFVSLPSAPVLPPFGSSSPAASAATGATAAASSSSSSYLTWQAGASSSGRAVDILTNSAHVVSIDAGVLCMAMAAVLVVIAV